MLVNYIRRFQPSFKELKNIIETSIPLDTLRHVNIEYQKGFINNCSHALDLLECITAKTLDLNFVQVLSKELDFFKEDPTISLMAKWDDVNVSIIGLTGINYFHFNISLYFKHYIIKIENSGNKVNLFKFESAGDGVKEKNSIWACDDGINNYMCSVINEASNILEGEREDNFIQSLQLNRKLITYLNH